MQGEWRVALCSSRNLRETSLSALTRAAQDSSCGEEYRPEETAKRRRRKLALIWTPIHIPFEVGDLLRRTNWLRLLIIESTWESWVTCECSATSGGLKIAVSACPTR